MISSNDKLKVNNILRDMHATVQYEKTHRNEP